MGLLAVENVTLTFGGLSALKDVSLSIEENELVGIIGPNGSGKSSLFNVITGHYRPKEGNVWFKGKKLNALRMDQITGMGIYRTFQNISLFDTLTVFENVLMGQFRWCKVGFLPAVFRSKKLLQIEGDRINEASKLLEMVDLLDKREVLACDLSYGEQRRIEIARALAGRPELILLDEPTAGLNTSEKELSAELIKNIRSRNKCTIMLVEHNMKVIMGICDRVIVLNQGEVIATGTPKEIQRNPDVIEAYLGTKNIHENSKEV